MPHNSKMFYLIDNILQSRLIAVSRRTILIVQRYIPLIRLSNTIHGNIFMFYNPDGFYYKKSSSRISEFWIE